MSRTIVLASILAALASSATAATPIDGLWATPQYEGRVEIAGCGDQLCGRLVDSAVLRRQPDMRNAYDRDPARRGLRLRGLPILLNLGGSGERWRGRIYNPADGRTYEARLRLRDADTLDVSGCVLRVFCQTQVWRRVR